MMAIGRKTILKLYTVKERLVSPAGEDLVYTIYCYEKNDCRLVFSLIKRVERLGQDGFKISFLEIKRADGSLVDFSKTVQAHTGTVHQLLPQFSFQQTFPHIFRCPQRSS